MWVLRSPDGETKRFRELTTLQQWIVEQRVGREDTISRTGETWKRLGDIAELASFFEIVDRARLAQPRPDRVDETNLIPPQPLEVTRRVPADDMRALAQTPPPAEADDSPSWDSLRSAEESHDHPGQEPAWAAAGPTAMLPRSNAVPDEPMLTTRPAADGTVKMGAFDDYDYEPPRRKTPWMLTAFIVLVAGGGVGIWLATTSGDKKPEQPTVTPLPPTPPVAAAAPDAAPVAAVKDTRVADAVAKLGEDTDAAYAEAEKQLDAAHVGDAAADAKVWAALALVDATWAQGLADDADLAKDKAAELRAESDRRLVRAEKFAKEAEGRAPNAPETALAQAEVLRLKKAPTAEVDKKLAAAGDSSDVLYARAMLRLRDGKTDEGRKLLADALAAREREGGVLVRARVRLALIALADKQLDEAKTNVDAALAVQPAHARAQTVKKRIEEAAVAAAAPPAKPEPAKPEPAKPEPTKPEPAKPEPRGEPRGGEPELSASVRGADYDGLVARADKLAENGDCGGATRYYEKALEARPGGVEALTGIGYCFLDRKDYGKALLNFRAALGISPRYGEALIGMAESYRYQGKKEEAAEYYRRYLEHNPGGGKAGMARKFLDELGPRAEPPKAEPPPPPEAPKPEPERPAPPPEPDKQAPPPPPDKLPDKPQPIPEAPPN
jgi:tetratricopeptide (TPR) repeat protein